MFHLSPESPLCQIVSKYLLYPLCWPYFTEWMLFLWCNPMCLHSLLSVGRSLHWHLEVSGLCFLLDRLFFRVTAFKPFPASCTQAVSMANCCSLSRGWASFGVCLYKYAGTSDLPCEMAWFKILFHDPPQESEGAKKPFFKCLCIFYFLRFYFLLPALFHWGKYIVRFYLLIYWEFVTHWLVWESNIF